MDFDYVGQVEFTTNKPRSVKTLFENSTCRPDERLELDVLVSAASFTDYGNLCIGRPNAWNEALGLSCGEEGHL